MNPLTIKHVIRLRGPWTYQTSPDSAAISFDFAAWPEQVTGDVCLARRFGCPSGLEPTDRVDLAITDLSPEAVVAFNGEPLATLDSRDAVRWDITARLRPRNELRIQIRMPGGIGADVRLEIR